MIFKSRGGGGQNIVYNEEEDRRLHLSYGESILKIRNIGSIKEKRIKKLTQNYLRVVRLHSLIH